MNYRHHFHAGNHADVLKHLTLALVIDALKAKDKPFAVVDSHAGAGLYDLAATAAEKTGEWQAGIGALLPVQEWPEAMRPYKEALMRVNPQLAHGGHLRLYPGSPRLMADLMRDSDRLTLGELHPDAVRKLRHGFEEDRRVRIIEGDGYHLLRSELPPREKRGLVHIDPPFEDKQEFQAMLDALQEGYRRFATGVYALWYPIKARPEIKRFHENLKKLGIPRILCAELLIHPDDVGQRLNGSGMILVNPPWQLDEKLRRCLPWVHERLAPEGEGGARIHWLVGETA
ncbi:MAG: 23S rRNA (adenine(2030)-N(6))-methyltransferase RlmJ [Gammaproteobacteria bacterium]|nr:23S rRNA (adenine(2030)-N(6))-methyltransferase RlmJ [Gammaproteobacteria bacterium]